jgi:uncharacterized protein
MSQFPFLDFFYGARVATLVLVVLCSSCGPDDNSATSAGGATHRKISADGYRDMDWLEMVPKDEIDMLKHPPPVDHTGSMRAQQTGTYNTIAALDGLKVRIPGYIVPLEADDKGNLTEFFLVPYYGACIHVPPPPPNQIIYVKLDKSVEAPEIMDPYGVKGILRVRKTANDVAGSAYTLEQAGIAPWEG